jgi:hypothetical protein
VILPEKRGLNPFWTRGLLSNPKLKHWVIEIGSFANQNPELGLT